MNEDRPSAQVVDEVPVPDAADRLGELARLRGLINDGPSAEATTWQHAGGS
jgi:hypothetical protein